MKLNDFLRALAVTGLLFVALVPRTAFGAQSSLLSLLPSAIGTAEQLGPAQRSGYGLMGFDPVSYLLDPEPRPGSASHEVTYRGLVWRFASRANQAAFESNPETFMPRIGGYDAAAAAEGRIVWADPTIYAVRDNRLYLFRNRQDRERFLADALIEKAAENRWSNLARELTKS